jgi:hypothetical protein
MENNLVRRCLLEGGIIRPLLIPASETGGLAIKNPSILIENDDILVNLRQVNYTFYHSEKKTFLHPWGELVYIHPEADQHLRTWNWFCKLDNNLNIKSQFKIDTSLFDTYQPQWEFVGLEDGRLVKWDEKYYLTGVRRDTTTNGEGRMELSELKITDSCVKEISRVRIEPPNDKNSYCEKNWMPILDQPFTYVKWSNPTEVVEVNPITGASKTTHLINHLNLSLKRDIRGGSQLLPIGGGRYLALTHEVDLFKSKTGRKDAIYYHRFVVWDKNWNIISYSDEFLFMDGLVEFSIGIADYDNHFLITFGFQDNAAYILKAPKSTIYDLLKIKA